MKSYKYSTKDRAERVAKTLGCTGSHHHNENGEKKFMPCKTHEIFKSKLKKDKKDEQEVTELVDTDGTWLSSSIGILDPASTGIGTKTTDQIVPAARNPRDPLLRGWYGYYGEGTVKEEDMSKAFGYEDTKDLDAKDTIKYFEKKLGDEQSAIERAASFGKKEKLEKNAPEKIKRLKNFVDRLILKEKELDESEVREDRIVDRDKKDNDLTKKKLDVSPLLLRNIRSIKKAAKENGLTFKELVQLMKDEQ
jgi:hypothetical protein